MPYYRIQYQRDLRSDIEEYLTRQGSSTEAIVDLARKYKHPIIHSIDETDPKGRSIDTEDESC